MESYKGEARAEGSFPLQGLPKALSTPPKCTGSMGHTTAAFFDDLNEQTDSNGRMYSRLSRSQNINGFKGQQQYFELGSETNQLFSARELHASDKQCQLTTWLQHSGPIKVPRHFSKAPIYTTHSRNLDMI